MQHLMEVCLLVILTEKTSYGYELLEELKRFGFRDEELNTSTLYRSLRQLEAAGSVVSDWEAGGPGPQRRVCRITDQGQRDLAARIERLSERRARIGTIIDAYNKLPDTKLHNENQIM
jgi:DNA-binding PadR family transcriptional regulator